MRFLCRFGEMMLKSRQVRHAFTQRLLSNVFDAFKRNGCRVSVNLEQAYLFVESDEAQAASILERVFGIHSISPVHSFPYSDFDSMRDAAANHFRRAVEGKRFAVRCRRVGKHAFSSRDVECAVGALLVAGGRVDLTDPQVTCRIDLRDDQVSFFTDEQEGAGGFPIGSQGRAVCLMSGGIDSPVAAWMALRRGLRIDYLFCNLGGPLQLWGPKSAAKHLTDQWSYGYKPSFYTIDFTEILSAFSRIDHRYRNILLKRFFYRAAQRLAVRIKADAFVTGESLGQVSTQTLSNLRTISRVTDLFPFRPLIAMDKLDIIRIARRIGTLEVSEQVPEFCNVAVSKPKTRSWPAGVEAIESTLPTGLLDEAMRTLTREDLITMSMPEPPESCAIDYIPANALYVWIAAADDRMPPPEEAAQVIESTGIHAWSASVTGDRPVVLNCRKGRLSRDAAAYLRAKGIEAYHFEEPQTVQDGSLFGYNI